MNPPNSERIQTAPYMDRVMPWGNETGRQCESRIYKLGWREAWKQRGAALRRVNPTMDMHESAYLALCEFPPSIDALEKDDVHALSEDDEKYVVKCREGLQLKLPQRAGVEKELDWVGANAHRSLPDVQSAPSYFVLNFMIAGKLNPKVLDDFWRNSWAKRLSPGDSKSKKQQSSVSEDQIDHDEENREEDLHRRLFGGE